MNNEQYPSLPLKEKQMNIISIKAIEDIGYDLQDSIVSLCFSQVVDFFYLNVQIDGSMQDNTLWH